MSRARWLIAMGLAAAALVAPAGAQANGFLVQVGGNGNGTVTSEPAGINCTVAAGVGTGACSANFAAGTTVRVTLTPAPGSLCDKDFQPPEGAQPSPGPCTYQKQAENELLVPVEYLYGHFVLSTHALTVSKTGNGSGTVTSSPAGIDCGTTCSKAFTYGSNVTLTATPDAGAVFKQWTGACNGQGPSCTLTIAQATSTNAVFDLAGATTIPTAPTTPTTDTAVGAAVIGAAAGRSRIGKRVVRLELVLDEPVSAVLTLVRKGSTLATKRFASVADGERVLTLTVPAGVAGGAARLRFVLTDAAGNTLSGKRSVRIPAPG